MSSSWKIRRSTGTCSGCDKEFEPEAEHYSLLTIGEEDWERTDSCAGCFKAEGLGPETLYWRTRRPKAENKKRQVDLEGLRVLFSQLVTMELDDTRRKLTFLIGMILTRKRRLRMGAIEREGDVDWIVLEVPKSETTYRVRADVPDPEEMPQLRELLQKLFDEDAESEDLLGGILTDEGQGAPEGEEEQVPGDSHAEGDEPAEEDGQSSVAGTPEEQEQRA